MFKLANQVLDHTDDVHCEILQKIANKNPQAKAMSADEVSKLDDTDFAITVFTKHAHKMNKFPIADKDSTWLSSEYFNETCYGLPKEAQEIAAFHIKSACERFGIEASPAVQALSKEAVSNVYIESFDAAPTQRINQDNDLKKYAEVSKICDNYNHAIFVMPNHDGIKTACEYFKQFSNKMPLDYRHKYAGAIQRRAGELAYKVTEPEVCKYASSAYSSDLDAHLASRRSLVASQPMFTRAFNKIASMQNEMEPMEFAQLLHALDKRASLDKYYGGYLVNPYEATFAIQSNPKMVKVSSKLNLSHADLGNVFIDKHAKIAQYFGKGVADSLRQDGAPAFEVLPNDAKEILAGIADGSL